MGIPATSFLDDFMLYIYIDVRIGLPEQTATDQLPFTVDRWSEQTVLCNNYLPLTLNTTLTVLISF